MTPRTYLLDSPQRAQSVGWLPIPSWAGYFDASNEGLVRSLPRTIIRSNGWAKRVHGGVLAQRLNLKTGYLQVTLYRPGQRETWNVHRLIALAFLGPCPIGLEVAHWDGDKRNNAITNLRYTTRFGNMDDRRRHGQIKSGEGAPHVKLTAQEVREIRNASGLQREIAARYGVCQTLISQIKRRVIWHDA